MSFEFSYTNLEGSEGKSSLLNLIRVVEGPVKLTDGWVGDRVNYDKKIRCFIEFCSGSERTPGFTDSMSREVDADYICLTYNISSEKITEFERGDYK
jgi:hypothetical protein